MTRHTIKAKEYKGEGGGTEIVVRLILDRLTLSMANGADAKLRASMTDKLVAEILPDLSKEVMAQLEGSRE